MIDRLRNSAVRGVLVGRGALRNPVDLRAGRGRWRPAARRARSPPAERGRFLLDYVDLLLKERLRRGRRVPPRRARPGAARPIVPGARPRALGDQQAARAEFLVHEGARQRLAPAGGDQRRRVDRAAARDHRGVLRRQRRRQPARSEPSYRSYESASGLKRGTASAGSCVSARFTAAARVPQLHHLIVVRERRRRGAREEPADAARGPGARR